jgi:hypothetical protein
MMRHEANATMLFIGITNLLKSIEQKLKKEGTSADLAQVYMTETKSLMAQMPALIANAGEGRDG